MPHRTVVQALAMAMLKRTTFEHDDASADTIWRAQHQEVRASWRRRAHEVLDDIASDGYEVSDLDHEDPNYDADHA